MLGDRFSRPVAKRHRLYGLLVCSELQRETESLCSPHARFEPGPALGSDVRRWTGWATGGLAGCPLLASAAPTAAR
jgi:hypothetical protein